MSAVELARTIVPSSSRMREPIQEGVASVLVGASSSRMRGSHFYAQRRGISKRESTRRTGKKNGGRSRQKNRPPGWETPHPGLK